MSALKKIHLWGEHADDDRLVRQILAGIKTATCCPTHCFMETYDGYHEAGYSPGEKIAVYDLKHNWRCNIVINEVYETTLATAPDKLWQGEANDSLLSFQTEHLACWKDLKATLDMPITASHFSLVETETY